MRRLLRFIWFPALILFVILGWVALDSLMGWQGPRVVALGVPLAVAGLALMSWCALLFAHQGRGTPHPFMHKTKRLVVAGPYRYVRNPMMWSVGMVLVGLALWLGSLGLWMGFACFLFFVRWFVPRHEEPDMEKRFGEEYRDYCRRVPRWWPRFPSPYNGREKMS